MQLLSGLSLGGPDESIADRPAERRSAESSASAKTYRVAPISEYLAAHASESFLKLSNRSLSEDDLRAIKALIKSSKCLTTLDFTDSSIRNDGARIIAEVLTVDLWVRANRPLLARAQLPAYGQRQRAGADASGGSMVWQACRVNSTVTALGLSGNRIMDVGVRAIGTMLRVNRTLQSLYLRNNAIGGDGARHLADALRMNKTLTTLNLKNNKLRAEGVRVLGEVPLYFASLWSRLACSRPSTPWRLSCACFAS